MKLTPIAANQTEVELADGTTVFFSYKTPVAAHVPGEGYCKTERSWSRTTSKHIGQFLRRNGYAGEMRHVKVYAQSWFDNLGAKS